MKILDFRTFEKKLSIAELNEPAPSNFNGNGNKRGDVLIQKVEDGDPLIVGRSSIVVDEIRDSEGNIVNTVIGVDNIKGNNDQYDPNLANDFFKNGRGHYIKTFIGSELDGTEHEFTLNNIEKTTEFGSSGPGRNTNRCEVIQAVFIHMNRVNPQIALTSENAVQLFQQFVMDTPGLTDFIKTSIDITPDMIDGLDDDWLYTFIEMPDQVNHFLNKNKENYIIVHNRYNGNSPYRAIKNKVKQFLHEVEISKFYPGDIIVVSNSRMSPGQNGLGFTHITQLINATANVRELIDLLNDLFERKLMCSLSLKKLKVGVDYNVVTNNETGFLGNNNEITPVTFDFTGVKICSTAENGKSSKILTTSHYRGLVRDRVMVFKSDKRGDLHGEVEGSTSRHGKISLQIINRIIRRYFQDFDHNTQDFRFVRRRVVIKELENNLLIDEINAVLQEIEDIENPDFNINTNMGGRDISNSKDGLISKLQSLEMVRLLIDIKTSDEECFNQIISDIFKYAMSIQVWHNQDTPPNLQGNLLTPKYFRVI